MTYFYTTPFRQALHNTPTMLDHVNVLCTPLTTAPSLAFGADRYLGIGLLADLLALPEWEAAPGSAVMQAMSTTVVNGTNYLVMPSAGFPFTTAVRTEAFAFTIGSSTGMLIGVTNTPIGDYQNIHPGDALTALKDTNVPLGASSWFMGWAPPVGTMADPIEGPLAMLKSAPGFEVSNTVHVWLYPQRANMIANPSFDLPGTDFWASNGALTRLPDGDEFYLHADGNVVESNIWPTRKGSRDEPDWTIQLRMRGDGPTKVGLVFWDRDGRGTGVDWGDWTDEQGVTHEEVWNLNGVTWTHVAVNRSGAQAYRAMLRVESQSGFLDIDEVLAEHGHLAGSADFFSYFDGTDTYGMRDDHFWYGGDNRAGKSYSMHYACRRAVVGRLFAAPSDNKTPINVITDDEVKDAGLVYQWVPAGTTVKAHIGVLYVDDQVADLVPQNPAGVLPYESGTVDGVTNPWV